jgi:hypothetical protein
MVEKGREGWMLGYFERIKMSRIVFGAQKF